MITPKDMKEIAFGHLGEAVNRAGANAGSRQRPSPSRSSWDEIKKEWKRFQGSVEVAEKAIEKNDIVEAARVVGYMGEQQRNLLNMIESAR